MFPAVRKKKIQMTRPLNKAVEVGIVLEGDILSIIADYFLISVTTYELQQNVLVTERNFSSAFSLTFLFFSFFNYSAICAHMQLS